MKSYLSHFVFILLHWPGPIPVAWSVPATFSLCSFIWFLVLTLNSFWVDCLKVYILEKAEKGSGEGRRERKIELQRKITHPSAGSLSRWPHWPRLEQTEARIPGLHLGLPMGNRAPSTCTFHCSPRHSNRKWVKSKTVRGVCIFIEW